MSEELTIIEAQSSELAVRRPPKLILEEATEAAKALKDVIANKKNPVMMNGEQYLEFEDWQTVARFYGITAKVTKTEFVHYGQVKGFSAHAVALRSDGQEISAAEAECLDDEEKWRTRARYEWQDSPNGRVRVKVGEEPVPLFQLKSMAQTRACAKAFRNVLAWVVVLAGYRPTPAEELGAGVGEDGGQAKAAPAERRADGSTTIKSVEVKKGGGGESGKRAWTRYDVQFADGRRGSTFSETDGKHAVNAQKTGALVRPNLAKTDKGTDLAGFEPLEGAKAEAAAKEPEAPHVDEPVAGPENVLTVRKGTTDAGTRWIIQTDKRELLTDKEEHANIAVAARAQKVGVTPTFEVLANAAGRKFNRILTLVPAASLQVAHQPTPETAAPPAAEEKPKRARKKKTREPGEEG